jgi:hypothetical protein
MHVRKTSLCLGIAVTATAMLWFIASAGGHPDDPDSGCKDHHGCGWKYADYEHRGDGDGYFYVHNDFPGQWIGPGRPARSAKNRFDDRLFKLSEDPSDPNSAERCLNPGESRPDFPVMRYVRVGTAGSRCP